MTRKSKYWQEKKVIVIGGHGFIGKQLVTTLAERGANVSFTSRTHQTFNGLSAIKVDPTKQEDLSQLDTNFDTLINVAAVDGNGTFKQKYSQQIIDINTRINLNVLLFAHQTNIKDVMLFSSSDIYENNSNETIKEDDVINLNSISSNGYKNSKLILELLAQYYCRHCDMRVYLPRPCYIYGAGDKYIDSSHSRLMPWLIYSIANDQSIVFSGDKDKIINLIYLEDLIDIVLNLIENKYHGPINISSPEIITVEEIVKQISTHLNKEHQVVFKDQTKEIKPMLDISNLLKLKRKFTSFKKGIAKTINSQSY